SPMTGSAASRRMQARSPSWFETAQERLLTMRVHRYPVNPVLGLTKSHRRTSFGAFRGHLSRPACSHVKEIAKQAGDTSDPGRTQVQAGFFIGWSSAGSGAVREGGSRRDGEREICIQSDDPYGRAVARGRQSL